jgi:hypothetical protein
MSRRADGQPVKPRTDLSFQERRPYQAPQVARVDLEADEVLSTGCKQATGLAASANTTGCLVGIMCAADGS